MSPVFLFNMRLAGASRQCDDGFHVLDPSMGTTQLSPGKQNAIRMPTASKVAPARDCGRTTRALSARAVRIKPFPDKQVLPHGPAGTAFRPDVAPQLWHHRRRPCLGDCFRLRRQPTLSSPLPQAWESGSARCTGVPHGGFQR